MRFGIHRHERLASCCEAGIDHPPRARIFEAHPLERRSALKLAHGDPAAEIGDISGRRIGVDRPADQRQGARLRARVFLGQIGRGGQRQRRRLADRDHMGIGAHLAQEVHEIERVILDIELALADTGMSRALCQSVM